jgi:hypothetical protein
MRTLTAGGVVVGLATATVSLLFYLHPSFKPCLGGSSAKFTGAPVFPHVRFRDYLVRNGTPKEDAAKQPNLLGAEVRFSYQTSSLRGARLPVAWSLLTIGRDGTLGAVVPDQDRALAMTVTPDGCSESGGKDLFVPIPDPGQRYRVVLELFRNARQDDRLALLETAIFRS